MDYNVREVAGRQAKQNGKRFEQFLQNVFKMYENQGIMKVDKAHENFKPLKPCGKGQYICVSCKSGQPDFRGCTRTGRSVVFEAKHTEADKITYAAVTQGEENNLEAYAQMNVLTGVIVQYGSGNIYFFPWIVWKNMRLIFGHLHIKESEAKQYGAKWLSEIDENIGVKLVDITLQAKLLIERKQAGVEI